MARGGLARGLLAGWRGLLAFWVVVLLVLGVGGTVLQRLGPPPAPVVAAAETASPPPPAGVPGLPADARWNGRIASPDPALQEPAPDFPPGTLPRIGADGRMAMQVYARPADRQDPRPKVAVLLSGFGLADAESRSAIALPGPVGLAVSVYSRQIDPLLEAARAAGHELLDSIPMESDGYPTNDAGFASLTLSAPAGANARNLQRALAHTAGAAGATGASDGFRGERFAGNPGSFGPVAAELSRRGLFYIDPRPGAAFPAGVAGRAVDVVIDDPPARAEMEAKLSTLERTARQRGWAIGLAGPLRPATLERLATWLQALEGRGVLLVPVSALAQPAAGAP